MNEVCGLNAAGLSNVAILDVGKSANLLFLNGDSLTNIETLASVALVIRRGWVVVRYS